MNETTKRDLKKFPLRPKRQKGDEIPVRVGLFGALPDNNQRARVAMGDKRIKEVVDYNSEQGREADRQYELEKEGMSDRQRAKAREKINAARKKREAEPKSMKEAVDKGVKEGS